MKRVITFMLICSLVTLSLYSEHFTVYAVHGDVTERTAKGELPVMAKDTHLTGNSRITIKGKSSLTIYLSESNKLVTLTEPGCQSLSTLLRRSKDSGKQASKWVKSLMASLVKGEEPEQTQRRVLQSYGGSHRGNEADRILADRFALWLESPRSQETPGATFALYTPNGEKITDPRRYDDETVAVISNKSDSYLFVNIVAVMPGGERELIFPVDTNSSNHNCSHLSIAPHSTVAFSEFSFFPSLLPRGTKLALVATEKPVDFTVLCGKLSRPKILTDNNTGVSVFSLFL